MFITKRHVPRRHFLKGVGVTLALPLLDAMVPARTALAQTAAVPNVRFGSVYLPQGFIMTEWTPDAVGTSFEFKSIAKPLEPFREHLTFLTNLDLPPNGGSGAHATSPANYLSGVSVKQTEGSDIYGGVTIDQLIAKQIGQDTLFPSIELATEDFTGAVGACETGYSCLYMNTLSWGSPTTPLPMEINPRIVFERIFGGTGSYEERLTRMRDNRSILDSITGEVRRFRLSLGRRDQARVDDFLTNIREIERRLQRAEQQKQLSTTMVAPAGIPEEFEEHCDLMYELIAIVLQANLSRVFSFMMARELHAKTYPELGATEGHHTMSHHAYNPERMAAFGRVNTYHTQIFSKFVKRLQDTPDGEGSLLDHSMIVYGSGMSWGTNHVNTALPLVVVGKGAGKIRGGRHIELPKGTPHSNMLLALGQRAGVEIEKFGISNGTVDL
jgi:hypothetical protein